MVYVAKSDGINMITSYICCFCLMAFASELDHHEFLLDGVFLTTVGTCFMHVTLSLKMFQLVSIASLLNNMSQSHGKVIPFQ